jgi:hypothetical protein
MKQDRFLLIILGLIGLLVLSAVVLFFLRREPQEYGNDAIPEGVVRNYILALQKSDYETAYGYLQDIEEKPTSTEFKKAFITQGMDPSNTSVQIGAVKITGSDANVDFTIIHTSNDPFDRTWEENSAAVLTQQNGQWRIVSMPYPYWGWEWYTTKPAP